MKIVLTALSLLVLSWPVSAEINQELASLESSTGGRIGISAINTGNNMRIQYRADERFPMGCTSKVIGVSAILQQSMNNNQLLQERVKYKKQDILSWAPITSQHLDQGMTVSELCAAAISYSDNTAMNLLTKRLGGPQGLNHFARTIGDKEFKLDHWWPDEAESGPDGKDSTTPAAMEKSLQSLALGKILAPAQRELLQTWLIENTTGNARIRAGVPKGWKVGDKTGTGSAYGTTNDMAIIWPPKCAPIVLVAYYTNNNKDASVSNDVIAKATQLVLKDMAVKDQCLGAAGSMAKAKMYH